mmetsp:Transcript_38456/g.54121  ORF Transcript_38456/g.54121 Transcript_38456/m.54121 type:complete len:502 (+) Transcript_38456:80-1585(+)
MSAMGRQDRWKRKIRSCFRSMFCCGKEDKGSTWDSSMEEGRQRQYRLESTKNKTSMADKPWWHKIACCHRHIQQQVGIGISPNQSLAMYLHWMFRVNFFFLFTLSCIVFFALTIFFAGLIIAAGRMDEECVRVGGKTFDSAGTAFADAFALSWTTFSTVGYGSTYPALGHENDNPTNCLFITAVCSLESFIGVLYSGFCGAILFGKVLRIQSHAQVIFSDPIVIRYGSGVENHSDEDDDEGMSDDGKDHKKKIPCPVLEFRIVNRLFNEVGGEIMDATLNVVTSIDANDADQSVRDNFEGNSNSFTRMGSRADSGTHHSVGNLSKDSGVNSATELSDRSVFSAGITSILRKNITAEDDPARLVNKRIFSKLLIEASDHPFFKRVWLARHVLDENSPILSPRVRRQIRKNNGYWPEHLNSYQGVKESLRFNQILVSLNGVSNVSASDVYAQKIYDHVDCNVGYQFVNLLYRDGDQLKVDTDLINDVREQDGGGGEPLTVMSE